MKYKQYKNIKLSCLGMGNMRLPVEGNTPDSPIDYKKAQEIIDYAMANGINYYDTAFVYHGGESENFLGSAIKKYDRSSLYLATKYYILADKDYQKMFEKQLEKLQTSYIDFYLIHGIDDTTIDGYLSNGCIEYFMKQKQLGKIKYLGFSSHCSPDKLRIVADHHEWDFAQIQINYMDWFYATAKEEYEILSERKIPVMVMEPVRGGRLVNLSDEIKERLKALHSEWSEASWALRFVRSLENVQVILSGMTTMEQIQDNITTFSDDASFGEAERNVIEEISVELIKELSVPCTGCRYCCDGCPKKIEIPDIMAIYNKFKYTGWLIGNEFDDIQEDRRASACIGCRSCERHCPQGIKVSEIMKKVAELETNPYNE